MNATQAPAWRVEVAFDHRQGWWFWQHFMQGSVSRRACMRRVVWLPLAAALLNGGSGRCTSIAHLAAFKVEPPIERPLTCEDELPLLAGNRPIAWRAAELAVAGSSRPIAAGYDKRKRTLSIRAYQPERRVRGPTAVVTIVGPRYRFSSIPKLSRMALKACSQSATSCLKCPLRLPNCVLAADSAAFFLSTVAWPRTSVRSV